MCDDDDDGDDDDDDDNDDDNDDDDGGDDNDDDDNNDEISHLGHLARRSRSWLLGITRVANLHSLIGMWGNMCNV